MQGHAFDAVVLGDSSIFGGIKALGAVQCISGLSSASQEIASIVLPGWSCLASSARVGVQGRKTNFGSIGLSAGHCWFQIILALALFAAKCQPLGVFGHGQLQGFISCDDIYDVVGALLVAENFLFVFLAILIILLISNVHVHRPLRLLGLRLGDLSVSNKNISALLFKNLHFQFPKILIELLRPCRGIGFIICLELILIFMNLLRNIIGIIGITLLLS